MDRAAACGFTHLFVTIDVPVRGNREGERRAGMTVPPTLTPGRILDAAIHPAWWWNLLKHKRSYCPERLTRRERAMTESVSARSRLTACRACSGLRLRIAVTIASWSGKA